MKRKKNWNKNKHNKNLNFDKLYIIFCLKLFKFHVVDFSMFFLGLVASNNDMACICICMIGYFQNNFNYDWPLCCVIFTNALICAAVAAFFSFLLSFMCTVIVCFVLCKQFFFVVSRCCFFFKIARISLKI